MTTTFRLHPLGDGVTEATVARWLKQPGDSVRAGEPVLEVETDKITLEVEAPLTGALSSITAPQGYKIKVGDALGEIVEGEAGHAEVRSTEESLPKPTTTSAKSETLRSAQGDKSVGRVSPVVSRMLAEHGLDVAQITGTGEGGRVTKQDVVDYLARINRDREDKADKQDREEQATASSSPQSSPSAPSSLSSPPSSSADDLVPLTPMRARIAEHMLRSVQTSPHVTTVFEFDFAAVAAHRAANKAALGRDGVQLTYLAYVVSATASALKQHRLVNSVWTDAGILLKRKVNIGIAVALPEGLLVPVIHHADELSLGGIARRIQDLAARARGNQLQPHELQGGTFSITNHGSSGSLIGTPIIAQPQCAILGLGAVEKRVKVIGDAIAIRPCAYVSLSFDHRILDGATADAFVTTIKRDIETWTLG